MLVVENLPANAGDIRGCSYDPWVRKIPRGRKWQPTPIFLLGEFHGQKSLVGYSLWGREELDTTERLEWRRQWHPTPVLLPGKSHGWRSLVGCSPWGCEESDMTERLHFHFSLLCIGEGNGNPLQCSCLENPRDGVAKSRTRLK